MGTKSENNKKSRKLMKKTRTKNKNKSGEKVCLMNQRLLTAVLKFRKANTKTGTTELELAQSARMRSGSTQNS